jgi:hypothetical protein
MSDAGEIRCCLLTARGVSMSSLTNSIVMPRASGASSKHRCGVVS